MCVYVQFDSGATHGIIICAAGFLSICLLANFFLPLPSSIQSSLESRVPYTFISSKFVAINANERVHDWKSKTVKSIVVSLSIAIWLVTGLYTGDVVCFYFISGRKSHVSFSIRKSPHVRSVSIPLKCEKKKAK